MLLYVRMLAFKLFLLMVQCGLISVYVVMGM
jgi:hypothetical protein